MNQKNKYPLIFSYYSNNNDKVIELSFIVYNNYY